MTDAEIIQALEHCVECDCIGCPNRDTEGRCLDGLPYSMVLGVIQRQQEAIEKLEKESADKERAYTEEYFRRKEVQLELKQEQKQFAEIRDVCSEMYFEAIKDFAEKLKRECNELEAKSPNKAYQTAMEDMLTYYFPKIIDKCLGEMVG